jgi:hypothetical protein
MNTWTITLHAQGTPLADDRTRETVLAAAHALAERFGLRITDIATTPASLTATLDTDEPTAVGFAAELRRATNNWHQAKHQRPLWTTPKT